MIAGSADFGAERDRKMNLQWLETAAVRRKTLPETFCMLRRCSIRERNPLPASGRAFRLRWGRVRAH